MKIQLMPRVSTTSSPSRTQAAMARTSVVFDWFVVAYPSTNVSSISPLASRKTQIHGANPVLQVRTKKPIAENSPDAPAPCNASIVQNVPGPAMSSPPVWSTMTEFAMFAPLQTQRERPERWWMSRATGAAPPWLWVDESILEPWTMGTVHRRAEVPNPTLRGGTQGAISRTTLRSVGPDYSRTVCPDALCVERVRYAFWDPSPWMISIRAPHISAALEVSNIRKIHLDNQCETE